MFTYKITGNITYNHAETEDGFATVEIDEKINVEEMDAKKAMEVFLEENEHYNFFGSLKTCDAETGGKKAATFRNQNENQTIDIDLVEK